MYLASASEEFPPHLLNISQSQKHLHIYGSIHSQYKNRHLDDQTFRSVAQLTTLLLHCSGISDIKNGTFQWLITLESLDLSDNRLHTITSSTFTGLRKLCYINLHGNRISYIGEGTFVNLLKLYELNLGQNRITFIHQFAFTGLRYLAYLYLDHNNVTQLYNSSNNTIHTNVLYEQSFDFLLNLTDCRHMDNKVGCLQIKHSHQAKRIRFPFFI